MLISQFYIFCPRMSKFLHFSCPDIKKGRFPSFSKDLPEKKNQILDDRGPAKNDIFCYFLNFPYFATK